MSFLTSVLSGASIAAAAVLSLFGSATAPVQATTTTTVPVAHHTATVTSANKTCMPQQ